MKIRKDAAPSIGRIIVCSDWKGNARDAAKVLSDVCDSYPEGVRTRFLIACGGFVSFDMPSRFRGMGVKDTESGLVDGVISEGERTVNSFLTPELVRKLKSHTDYVSFGVDSFKSLVSTTNTHISEMHVELVVVVDLGNGSYHWTGKSYPSSGQEDSLIRIPGLQSHFIQSDFGKIMVLGCHDLSVFNNRGMERAGEWRRSIKAGLRELARKEEPVIVLQHPHVTDTHKTWYNSWTNLERLTPSVKEYAGAGRYYREGGARADLNEVLEKTRKGNTVDFIFS